MVGGAWHVAEVALQSKKEWLFGKQIWDNLEKSSLGSYLSPFQKHFLELDQKCEYIF